MIEIVNTKQNVNEVETGEQSKYMFGLLELNVVKEILVYKDLRSVIKWCKKNDVFILHQGNGQFVNEYEFTLSLYKPFIQALKLKHSNWEDIFVNYVNGDLNQLLSVGGNKKLLSSHYKPKTSKAISFLNNIKAI